MSTEKTMYRNTKTGKTIAAVTKLAGAWKPVSEWTDADEAALSAASGGNKVTTGKKTAKGSK